MGGLSLSMWARRHRFSRAMPMQGCRQGQHADENRAGIKHILHID